MSNPGPCLQDLLLPLHQSDQKKRLEKSLRNFTAQIPYCNDGPDFPSAREIPQIRILLGTFECRKLFTKIA